MIPISDKALTELCGKHDIYKEELQFLGGGKEYSDGTVYTLVSNGKKRVLKVLAIEEEKNHELKTFEERIHFAHFLGENGVQIAYPKLMNSGSLYANCSDGKYVFVAYVMNYCEGQTPETSRLTTEFSREWGKLIGRTHKITKQYPSWKNLKSKKFDYGYQDEIAFFENWCKDDAVKTKWREIHKYMDGLPKDRECYGLIHNDNHQKNIIVKNHEITLIDIDCVNGQFFLQDITVPLQGIMFDMSGGMERPIDNMEPLKKYFDHFINGYEQENHLDNMWLKEINTFINYRRLLLFTAMQDYLNTNQPLKSSFIEMIEDPPVITI